MVGRLLKLIQFKFKVLSCYLNGGHHMGVHGSANLLQLRCKHCGKASPGWALRGYK